MIFAEKGLWDVVGEQGPAIVALLLSAAIVMWFGGYWTVVMLKWIMIQYVGPIRTSLDDNGATLRRMDMRLELRDGDGATLKKIAESNENIVKINTQMNEKLGEQPSDIPGKLAAAKCLLSREQIEAVMKLTKELG